MCCWVSYRCFFLWLRTYIHVMIAISMMIPMNTTPPIPPPAAIVPRLPSVPGATGDVECVPTVVGLMQSAWVVSELNSIGQLGYTSMLLPWTRIDVCPPLTHCSTYDSTWVQFRFPDSSARYNTTCWSLVHTKCSVLIWVAVNEHRHLELMADIIELVMSASFCLVFWNCSWYNL